MRIVVLGSQGQLGRDLVPRLPGEVIPWTRSDCDFSNFNPAPLVALKPDIVINCAAYNLVDQAEVDSKLAIQINGDSVGKLALACKNIGAKFIHFSTDYVFDSPKYQPIPESATPAPVSLYGASKNVGETLIRIIKPQYLIIRTCGLYGVWGSGGKGGNFVETMLRIAGQGKPLKVVNDQTCTPTYTADLAETTIKVLNEVGIIHATNAGSCTWYEFASEIFRFSNLSPSLTPITSAEFGAKAKRPTYSVLANERLEKLGIPMRPWRDALTAYLAERGQRR